MRSGKLPGGEGGACDSVAPNSAGGVRAPTDRVACAPNCSGAVSLEAGEGSLMSLPEVRVAGGEDTSATLYQQSPAEPARGTRLRDLHSNHRSRPGGGTKDR